MDSPPIFEPSPITKPTTEYSYTTSSSRSVTDTLNEPDVRLARLVSGKLGVSIDLLLEYPDIDKKRNITSELSRDLQIKTECNHGQNMRDRTEAYLHDSKETNFKRWNSTMRIPSTVLYAAIVDTMNEIAMVTNNVDFAAKSKAYISFIMKDGATRNPHPYVESAFVDLVAKKVSIALNSTRLRTRSAVIDRMQTDAILRRFSTLVETERGEPFQFIFS